MQLEDDHLALRQMMQAFAEAMAASCPDMQDIIARRIAFSQLFRQHMERENILVTALRKPDKGVDVHRIIRTHEEEMRSLFLKYNAHINIWSPSRVTQDLPGYSTAVLGLQKILYERMEWEEATLYPLA